jgi:5-methylcytosine-specific restriction protein A
MKKLKMLPPRVATLKTATAKPLTVERTRGSAWMATRARILKRANGLCECGECKALGRLLIAHEVDHIAELVDGGSDADINLQAMNRDCHKRKTEASRRARTGLVSTSIHEAGVGGG